MSDLSRLFASQEVTRRWKAESENASARLEIARIKEHCAYLVSQHEPVNSLGLDRERLRLVLSYIHHGDLQRLLRDFETLQASEIKGKL